MGALALGTEASFDVNGIMTTGKRIIGIIEGDSVPDLCIPSRVEPYQQGRFPFDKLVKFYSLDQINQAYGPVQRSINRRLTKTLDSNGMLRRESRAFASRCLSAATHGGMACQ